MNIQLKNVFKNFGFLQNLSNFMLPIIVVVAALILFIPTKILRGGLKKDLEKTSISKAKRIKSLNNDIIPIEQWKIEKKYQDTLASDANRISLLAIQSTQRELLSYKIFPEPNESSILIFKEFGEKYRDGIESMMKKFGACLCPSEKELDTNLQTVGLADSSRSIGRISRSQGKTYAIEKTIIDEICVATAKNACFYGNPLDIAGFMYWEPGNQ